MWGIIRVRRALLAALALAGGLGAAQAAQPEGAAFYRHCIEAMEEGAPRLAMILCERSARSPEATAEVFETLGDVYRANGLGAEAKDAYRRAIRLDGDETRLRAKIRQASSVPDSSAIPPPDSSWLRPGETPPEPETTVLSSASLRQQAQAQAPTKLVPETAPYSGAESWGAGSDGERISVESLPPPSEPQYLEAAPPAPPAPPQATAAPLPAPAAAGQGAAEEPKLAKRNGPYRVQLAAMREEASAKALSQRLVSSYPTVLSELTPAFEVKEIDGQGRFHRVQFTGLASLEEARDLCARLRAFKQDCFVPLP